MLVALLCAAPGASAAEWVAGDGHVHTCYSHDAWCGPTDDDPLDDGTAFYSFGGTVTERFGEASAKGLRFLVISDHDRVDAWTDPGWGAQGVTGVHAYEASLAGGHAQMLGAKRQYAEGSGNAAATTAMADALRVDGGLFQANHPGYRVGTLPTTCADVVNKAFDMHWQYGFEVLPDTVEVWNATTLLRPSELYWECWLQRGARLGALAGSDSHGANHVNIGFPMTWAFAKSASELDVLAALRAGRTTLSRVAPNQGGVRLLLEGDRDRNGTYESAIGDEVPPRTPLRVRSEGGPGRGLLRIRANGKTVEPDGQELEPGGEVRFEGPADAGWVRATLFLENGTQETSCEPSEINDVLSTCSKDLAVAAMTSPIWVGAAAPAPKLDPPGPPPKEDEGREPDSQPPIPPNEQGGAQPMPDVPPQRGRAARVDGLRATWFRRVQRERRSQNVRLRWYAPEGPYWVQARRPGTSKWRTLAERTGAVAIVVHLKRGPWLFRVQARPAGAEPSGWRSIRVRL